MKILFLFIFFSGCAFMESTPIHSPNSTSPHLPSSYEKQKIEDCCAFRDKKGICQFEREKGCELENQRKAQKKALESYNKTTNFQEDCCLLRGADNTCLSEKLKGCL